MQTQHSLVAKYARVNVELDSVLAGLKKANEELRQAPREKIAKAMQRVRYLEDLRDSLQRQAERLDSGASTLEKAAPDAFWSAYEETMSVIRYNMAKKGH
jgi:hypothetical protein